MNSLTSWIAASDTSELANYLLANVPGLPPILQTMHLLCIAALMASAVMIDLRILGTAVPSQSITEMINRLRLWVYWALLGMFCSGVLFVLARPGRYFANPVFQIKFALLVPAIACSLYIFRMHGNNSECRVFSRAIALVSLLLWLGTVLAGRWIAYSEYLFWPA